MSEHSDHQADTADHQVDDRADDGADREADHVDVAQPAVARTGNDRIDQVLESVARIEGRPLEEQVAIFEAAHEALRAALSDAGREPDAPGQGARPGSGPFPGPRPR